MKVLSFGGGVQTVTMSVMACKGDLPTPDVPQYDGSGGGIRRYWSLDCIVRIDNSAGPDAIVQTEIVCPGPKLRGWEDGKRNTIAY